MFARSTIARAYKEPILYKNGLIDLTAAISGEKIRNKFKLFDVSLRDGLQTWKDIVPLSKKCNMLTNIMKKHNPDYGDRPIATKDLNLKIQFHYAVEPTMYAERILHSYS